MTKEEYDVAERELAEALGIFGDDPPKWTNAMLKRAERYQIRQWRYHRQIGRCTPEEADAAIAGVQANSKLQYDEANPRRPERWRRAVNKYRKLRPEIIEAGGLTRNGALEIVDHVSAKAAKSRKAYETFRRFEKRRHKRAGKKYDPGYHRSQVNDIAGKAGTQVRAFGELDYKGDMSVSNRPEHQWTEELRMWSESARGRPDIYEALAEFLPTWGQARKDERRLNRERKRIIALLKGRAGQEAA